MKGPHRGQRAATNKKTKKKKKPVKLGGMAGKAQKAIRRRKKMLDKI